MRQLAGSCRQAGANKNEIRTQARRDRNGYGWNMDEDPERWSSELEEEERRGKKKGGGVQRREEGGDHEKGKNWRGA